MTRRTAPTAAAKAATTPPAAATEATEADAPDTTPTTDEATPAESTDTTEENEATDNGADATPAAPTKADRRAAGLVTFGEAVTVALDATDDEAPYAVPEGDVARVTAAYGELDATGRRKADEALAARMTAAIAPDEGDPDYRVATAAGTLRTACKSVTATKAVESGPDATDILAARLGTVAAFAVGALAGLDSPSQSDALGRLPDGVAEAFGALARAARENGAALADAIFGEGDDRPTLADPDSDPNEYAAGLLAVSWPRAYGGRVPTLTKTPGRRSGTGGARSTSNRPADALAALAGKKVRLTYKGRTFEASLVKGDGRGAVRFDGTDYTSPTGAAKAAIGSHPEAPESPSVNGWDEWTMADGTSLADAYEAERA